MGTVNLRLVNQGFYGFINHKCDRCGALFAVTKQRGSLKGQTMSLLSPSPPLKELTSRQIQWIGAGYAMNIASMAGQTTFIAQFNTSIRQTFELSHGAFGGLYTIATLVSSICLIWAGAQADRVGPRKLAVICLVGLALVAVFMASVTHVVVLGIALFGLRFFGQGMMTHISTTMLARWFNRFRGRALSFAQLGMPSAEAVMPFLLTISIVAFGWRQVWLAAAVVLVLIMLPAIVFLLRDPPDGKRALARGDVNPDGDLAAARRGQKWTRNAVLRDPLFWIIIPGFMGPPAIGTLFIFHQAHLAALKGWELTVFTAFFPVLSVTIVVVSIISGNLVDRFGAWRLMPFVLLPEAIGCILLGTLDPSWTIPLFFISFGMTAGMMSPIFGALWVELYGSANLGAIRALATSTMVLASAIGPGIAGGLIDLGVELDRQAFFYAAYCLAAVVGYFLSRPLFLARTKALAAEG